ncbi:MAG: hypothetical protein KA170_13135 [Candidatus Promineofilum sp.]|nr:hypothetical protein [Promineifilum sp.]
MINHNSPVLSRWRVVAWLGAALALLTACGSAPTDSAATATFPSAPVVTDSALPGGYPPATPLAELPTGYPATTAAPPVEPGATAGAEQRPTTDAIYMPYIGQGAETSAEAPSPDAPSPDASSATPEPPTDTPTVEPAPTIAAAVLPGASPTPINVADFDAAAAELAARGETLVYNKIGFHVTFLEEADQLDGWMQRLDDEGVPFFLKSVDNAEPLYKAQELMKVSGVEHTLVYRSTLYDVPDYNLDPVLAAETYWELEKAIWPPELDPSVVWLETMNELDKNRSEWLAQFSLRTAQLALRDGQRWAAFGWASGEPEPSDWESPAMLDLLRLIADHPDQLAIALHEYSYTADDIAHDYPHKVGRFLDLFRVADKHGIARPTVLITEWGWSYDHIPAEPLAMEDVTWAARLYAAYPQVKGAAIWNLGKLEDVLLPLNTQLRDLIDNMLALSLDTTFSAPAAPEQAPLDAGLFPPPAQ